MMHKLTIAAAAATAILCAGVLSSERANALVAGGAETLRAAIQQVDPVDRAHYRRCWRGYHRWHCRHRHYYRW
jgi:outer membrane murein-binding lipoprotein Lpp